MRILIFVLLMASQSLLAAELDKAQQARYLTLIAELRCLVCQNQNIADSNAPLAQDLRAQVQEMILRGDSDQVIKAYMVERYGDFVLYRPPVKPQTWLLWGGPFVLLFVGLFVAWRLYQRKPVTPEQTPDAEAIAHALHEEDHP